MTALTITRAERDLVFPIIAAAIASHGEGFAQDVPDIGDGRSARENWIENAYSCTRALLEFLFSAIDSLADEAKGEYTVEGPEMYLVYAIVRDQRDSLRDDEQAAPDYHDEIDAMTALLDRFGIVEPVQVR